MQKLCRILFSLFITISFIGFLFACAPSRQADIDSSLVSAATQRIAKEGLEVSVKPLLSDEQIIKYFGSNIKNDYILPVFVSAHNKTGNSVFLIDSDSASVSNTGYTEKLLNIQQAKKVTSEKDQGLSMAVAMVPILWPVYGDSISNPEKTVASKIKGQNLALKALRKQTLPPGKKLSGFVYYMLPDDQPDLTKVFLMLRTMNITKSSSIDFTFQLNLKEETQDEK
jgi:hypothetical protein